MSRAVDLTRDHMRLLGLISLYTRPSEGRDKDGLWIKDVPLMTFLYEGIVQKVFNWDYAPKSVLFPDGRRFINYSQEGFDDINDLREWDLIYGLKLTTSRHQVITAFQISLDGQMVAAKNTPEEMKEIKKLTGCPKCGSLLEVELEGGIKLKCTACGDFERLSTIEDIEDVSYATEPFFPPTPGVRPEAKDDGGIWRGT